MSLKNFAEWNNERPASSCGSSCGAEEEKPAACGAEDK